MAITLAIWQDLSTRMKNLRGDMVGQWQGDLDNTAIQRAIMTLNATIEVWQQARPAPPPPP